MTGCTHTELLRGAAALQMGLLSLCVVATVGIGCFHKTPVGLSENGPDTGEVVTAKLEPPLRTPQAGRVDLKFAGAVTKTVRGAGGECFDWESENFTVYLRSSDVEGPGTEPDWLLTIGRFDARATGLRAYLTVGGRRFTSAPIATSSRSMKKTPDGLEVVLHLQPADRAGPVTVTGTIRCPKYQTGTKAGPGLIKYLSRAAGAPTRAYFTFDFGRAKDTQGASVVVPAEGAEAILAKVRRQLPHGWVAFLGTDRWLGEERHDGLEVVLGPGKDQFDILRLARADAANYDMGTEALVKKLQSFDQAFGIDIIKASTDTIEFKLKRPPSDTSKLAKDIEQFCPDVVSQGVGTTEKLAEAIRETGRVFLWWD